MTNQQEKSQSTLALWCCDYCTLWWICQPTTESNVWRLFRLSKFPNPSLEIGKCPVWKVSGPDASVCPECGSTMSKLSLPKEEIPTPYVALQN